MSYSVKVDGMQHVSGAINKARTAAFGVQKEMTSEVKGLKLYAQKLLIKATSNIRYSQLYKAIMRMTGQRRPLRDALVSAVRVEAKKNIIEVGVYGKLSRAAKQLDVGRRQYNITVTPKMRRFFMALFIRGLITAPLRATTTTIVIPAQKPTNWRRDLLKRTEKAIKDALSRKFGK
jgi:hypothetical protein